jgi:hypothetical protein
MDADVLGATTLHEMLWRPQIHAWPQREPPQHGRLARLSDLATEVLRGAFFDHAHRPPLGTPAPRRLLRSGDLAGLHAGSTRAAGSGRRAQAAPRARAGPTRRLTGWTPRSQCHCELSHTRAMAPLSPRGGASAATTTATTKAASTSASAPGRRRARGVPTAVAHGFGVALAWPSARATRLADRGRRVSAGSSAAVASELSGKLCQAYATCATCATTRAQRASLPYSAFCRDCFMQAMHRLQLGVLLLLLAIGQAQACTTVLATPGGPASLCACVGAVSGRGTQRRQCAGLTLLLPPPLPEIVCTLLARGPAR